MSFTVRSFANLVTFPVALRDSSAWGLLWNIIKHIVPKEVTESYERVITTNGLPRMDCAQLGLGPENANISFGPIDGKQHVLSGLTGAPPSGFASFNYAADIHHETGETPWVISYTADSSLSISGGRFIAADIGYLVERAPGTLMVHRTEHYHGTELYDIAPTDQEACSYGLSFSFPEYIAKLWPKTKRWAADRYPHGLEEEKRDVVEKADDPNTPDAAKRKRAEDSDTSDDRPMKQPKQ